MSRAAAGLLIAAAFLGLAGVATPPPRRPIADQKTLVRGRFLVAYGGCNECHTPGWRENDGRIPTSRWMTGSSVGFRGPWGTVYPANVRLWFAESSEDDWLHAVDTRAGHPPMKWTDLRALSVPDRRAIYRFIRALGPAGSPAPDDVPPGREPKTPYLTVVPHTPAPTSTPP